MLQVIYFIPRILSLAVACKSVFKLFDLIHNSIYLWSKTCFLRCLENLLMPFVLYLYKEKKHVFFNQTYNWEHRYTYKVNLYNNYLISFSSISNEIKWSSKHYYKIIYIILLNHWKWQPVRVVSLSRSVCWIGDVVRRVLLITRYKN